MKTARATLRPWRHDEADRLFDIVSRREVTAWLGSPEPWSRDQVTNAIAKYADRVIDLSVGAPFEPPVSLAIVPDATGVPVGSIICSHFPGGTEAEIGWYLHPDAQGQGWASEAGAAMLAHVVASGVDRVWAGMWPHNQPSAAVCRRIGMTELGVGDDPWYGTIEYPLGRFFCVWRAGTTDPRDVLAELNAVAVRQPSPEPPPIGPDGITYPGR